jgi:hypothetical protein
MRSFPSYVLVLPSLVAVAAAFAPAACNPDTSTGFACGPGTQPSGDICVPSPDSGADAPATPPIFAGVNAVAPISSKSLFVSWLPASDAQTPPEKMVYRVYAANSAGGENFKSPIVTSAPGANHVEINGLAPDNSTWFIVVRALNVAGLEDDNSVEKSAQCATDTNPPTFGGATAAAPAGGGQVTLSWDPPATDDHTPKEAIEYLVYQGDSTGVSTASPIAISDPGASSYTVKNLPDPKTDYYFIVRARDAAGNVDRNTTKVHSKPGPDVTPPVFAGCTGAVAKDAGSITVTWSLATDDVSPQTAIEYDLYASTTPGGENFSGTPNNTYTNVTSGLVTGLSPGTTWYIVCRAKDATGNQDKNTSEVSDKTLLDSTPPVFAGITSVDGVAADTATLHWAAATDNLTDPADIVYVVYQRDKDATPPTYPATPAATTKGGVTSFAVTGLASSKGYCWNVHAKDTAGNEDKNTVEQCATTQISFEKGVQPIFSLHCAVTGCHVGPSPTGGMVLADGFAYSYTVNVTSNENPPMKRIAPGDSANSYLYQKITGHPATGTSVMPPTTTGDVLADSDKNTILQWILEGAPNN